MRAAQRNASGTLKCPDGDNRHLQKKASMTRRRCEWMRSDNKAELMSTRDCCLWSETHTFQVLDTVDMEDIGEKKAYCRCWKSTKVMPYLYF